MFKIKFKKFNWLVKLITFGNIIAITLAPFGIYVNQKKISLDKVSKRTKNHESIHWKQQIEMFVLSGIISLITIGLLLFFKVYTLWIIALLLFPFLFFYLWYFVEWIVRGFIGTKAYRNVCFEREAYSNDDNLDYLKTRKHFSQFKYLKKK